MATLKQFNGSKYKMCVKFFFWNAKLRRNVFFSCQISTTDVNVIIQTFYEIALRYCEIIINCGVLIFIDFVVHKNKNPTKYNFSIDCCLQCLNTRIQEPMDQCILQKPRKLVPRNKNTVTVLQIYMMDKQHLLKQLILTSATYIPAYIISMSQGTPRIVSQ